jgi:hypothetical protein
VTVTATETKARQRLMKLLETEFTEVTWKNDRLNESLAQDGALGAVYPAAAVEQPGQGLVLNTTLNVQLFRQWTNALDPEEEVDPAGIEEWAERLRRACQADLSTPGDTHVWYFRVARIEYPPDPSGNVSRLLATVFVDSQNPALVETSG